MSKWQQGDVALVLCDDNEWRLAFYLKYEGAYANWRFADGMLRDSGLSKARRVAVIDFENREQVERLYLAMWQVGAHQDAMPDPGSEDYDEDVREMQAALREFAKPTPPKPEEPKGRFAEVVDGNGEHWFKLYDLSWAIDGEFSVVDGWRKWDEIDAVEILSEGVVS